MINSSLMNNGNSKVVTQLAIEQDSFIMMVQTNTLAEMDRRILTKTNNGEEHVISVLFLI